MKYLEFRQGYGDQRVAYEYRVSPEQVRRHYWHNTAKRARNPGVPMFNGHEPVNPCSAPSVAVILLEEGDEPFHHFSLGYNVLDNVDPREARRLLLRPNA